MDKTNIYGDYKVCIKCKDPADVVEKTKNYCVKCWFEHIEGKNFNYSEFDNSENILILDAKHFLKKNINKPICIPD